MVFLCLRDQIAIAGTNAVLAALTSSKISIVHATLEQTLPKTPHQSVNQNRKTGIYSQVRTLIFITAARLVKPKDF